MGFKRSVSDNTHSARKNHTNQQKTRFASQKSSQRGADTQVRDNVKRSSSKNALVMASNRDNGASNEIDIEEFMNDTDGDLLLSQWPLPAFKADESNVCIPCVSETQNEAASVFLKADQDDGDVTENDQLRGQILTLEIKLKNLGESCDMEKELLLKTSEEKITRLEAELSHCRLMLDHKTKQFDFTVKKEKDMSFKTRSPEKRDRETETYNVGVTDASFQTSPQCGESAAKRLKLDMPEQSASAWNDSDLYSQIPPTCPTTTAFPVVPSEVKLQSLPSTSSAVPEGSNESVCDIWRPIHNEIDKYYMVNMEKIAPVISTTLELSEKICGHFHYNTESYRNHFRVLQILGEAAVAEVIQLNKSRNRIPQWNHIQNIFELSKRHILNFVTVIIRIFDLERKNLNVAAAVYAKLREARNSYLTWNQLEIFESQQTLKPWEKLDKPWIALQDISVLECPCVKHFENVAICSIELIDSLCHISKHYSQFCSKIGKKKFQKISKTQLQKTNSHSNVAYFGNEQDSAVIELTQDENICSTRNLSVTHGGRKTMVKEECGIIPLICMVATVKVLPNELSKDSMKASLKLLETLSANGHLDISGSKNWLNTELLIDLFSWPVESEIPKLLLDILFNIRSDSYFLVFSMECIQEKRTRKSFLTGIALTFDDIVRVARNSQLKAIHYLTIQCALKLLSSVLTRHTVQAIHVVACCCWDKFSNSLSTLILEMLQSPNGGHDFGGHFLKTASVVLKTLKPLIGHINSETWSRLESSLHILLEATTDNEYMYRELSLLRISNKP